MKTKLRDMLEKIDDKKDGVAEQLAESLGFLGPVTDIVFGKAKATIKESLKELNEGFVEAKKAFKGEEHNQQEIDEALAELGKIVFLVLKIAIKKRP